MEIKFCDTDNNTIFEAYFTTPLCFHLDFTGDLRIIPL